jgi:hypothetical protein
VFAFSWQKSLTQRGSTALSAFGTKNAGDAFSEDEGRMHPASKCCWIRIPQASQNFHGHEQLRVEIVLLASFSLILHCTVSSISLTCGISLNTSAYLSWISRFSFSNCSTAASYSICPCMAATMSMPTMNPMAPKFHPLKCWICNFHI